MNINLFKSQNLRFLIHLILSFIEECVNHLTPNLKKQEKNKKLLIENEIGVIMEKTLIFKGDKLMELIQSFSVDHTAIVPGIFLSRQDVVGDGVVTTYDIRLKRPNVEPVIDIAAMHSLEHLIATTLRNDPVWKDEVVYWGPMGCLTGFYLILKGGRAPREIYDLVLGAFRAVSGAEEVPGATAVNCGNYLMHNLAMAKWYAAEFVRYLEANSDDLLIFEYPETERLVTEDGRNFYDS